MELVSSSVQDLEIEKVDEHVVTLDDPQEEEENINLDERGVTSKVCDQDSKGCEQDSKGCEQSSKSPEVGMVFSSVEGAYEFYNKYAYLNGFGIIKAHTRLKEGETFEVTLGCDKGGKAKLTQDLAGKRAKMSRKTDCKARIIVRLGTDGLWLLVRLFLEHNHSCTPNNVRLFRSHRNLSLARKKQLEYDDAARVSTSMSFQTLGERGGGDENLSYTERDCSDYLTKLRGLKLKEGDAQAIVDYFIHKNKEDPGFFYAMDLDEGGRLRNVFWADSRSRAMYTYFNDVISFDTTYLTNKYDMPFSPFVGVNHHGLSILLGASLLGDEKTDTYVWLFKTWMACMGDVAPKAIITDQCKAIGNAVANVFPNSKHRLCLWHILKKVPEKFAGFANYHNIKGRLYDVVYDSLRFSEFEEGWEALLKDYDLYNNEWLKSLFQDRKMWAPVFVKDTFWAGMSSTQRSESMKAYFDRYVTCTTSLQEFFISYEKALKGKFEKETIEDFDASDKQASLISRLKFEEQLSQIYTPKIFRKFQKEMQKCLDCSISLVRKDGVIKVYEVREYVKDTTYTYEVLFSEGEIEVRCICCLFEFQGIFCAHVISVLKEEHIMEIPPRYICNRWRKNFKRDYRTCPLPVDVIPKSSKELYDNLYRHGFQCLLDIVEVGATSKEKHDWCIQLINEMRVKVNEGESRTSEDLRGEKGKKVESAPSKTCAGKVKSPTEVRGVGRPPKLRKVSIVEKEVAKKKKQVSRVPPWTINQSYSPFPYGHPFLPPQANFIVPLPSQTSGNFAPRAEWGEGAR